MRKNKCSGANQESETTRKATQTRPLVAVLAWVRSVFNFRQASSKVNAALVCNSAADASALVCHFTFSLPAVAGPEMMYMPAGVQEITPSQEGRAEASDKRAYDQNYECTFEDENMPLLTHELISEAQRVTGLVADRQAWSVGTLQRLWRAEGALEAGMDVARSRDLTAVPVFERQGERRVQVAELIMEGMRLPDQVAQMRLLLAMPRFRRVEIDMTGIGLGVYETLEDEFGSALVGGVNFGTTEPVTDRIRSEGRKAVTARVTEIMATDLLGVFEDRTIEIMDDPELRDDLRKPEKVVSPGGRVSIAASRDGKGHADRFWGMALAVRAGYSLAEPGVFRRIAHVMQGLRRRVMEGGRGRRARGAGRRGGNVG